MNATPYRDARGRTEPADRIAGPGHLYVGNLHRGRVVMSTTGERMKVVNQGEGSTTVRVTRPGTAFTRKDGSVGRIQQATEDRTIARGTVVRPLVGASMVEVEPSSCLDATAEASADHVLSLA